MRSYYGRPVIKEPTWTWEIPTYFFTGGLAGASSVLSLCGELTGQRKLARTALYVGAAADLVSPALLISDLGRPERFHHMLRVVKVTSPMNVGSWVLLVSGGASTTAAVLQLVGQARARLAAPIVSDPGRPAARDVHRVLVADTAVPVWHDGRHELPWIFGASAAASAGAAASDVRPSERRRTGAAGRRRRGSRRGRLMQAMELRLGTVGEVYHSGRGGEVLVGREGARGRRRRAPCDTWAEEPYLGRPRGALVCAGELCLRWSVFKAGFQSARDPKYVVESQRLRIERAGDEGDDQAGELGPATSSARSPGPSSR